MSLCLVFIRQQVHRPGTVVCMHGPQDGGRALFIVFGEAAREGV